VKEVGFRSTRIQTIDTSIISVPNGNLANMSVKNFGVRVFRLMDIKIGITYDTPPDRIELFTEGLKKIKNVHPMLSDDIFYIHFISMADSSLQIMFRVYIETKVYGEELKIKEQVNLSIMRLAELLGISFAFPSTSVYVESMPNAPTSTEPSKSDDEKTKLDTFYEDLERRFSQE
jgi:MscS family membrane protein